MFALAAVPAAILGLGLLCIPDSPRWLAMCGLVDRARAALQRLRAPDQVEAELHAIRQGMSRGRPQWADLLGLVVRPALIVGVGLAVAQQITRINTVI